MILGWYVEKTAREQALDRETHELKAASTLVKQLLRTSRGTHSSGKVRII